MKKTTILAVIIILTLASISLADKYEEKSMTFPHDDIERLVIKIDMDAVELNFRCQEFDNLASAKIEYRPRRSRVSADYEKDGTTGILTLESECRTSLDMDTKDNIWEIVISDKYETELVLDLGGSDAKINLGGLPLVLLKVDVGVGSAEIDFDKPNPRTAERIMIDAGAGELDISNIGNANPEKFLFDGGVGEFNLDFTGDYRGKTRARVSLGLGSMKVFLPQNLAVKIATDEGFMSSVNFKNMPDMKEDDDYYESSNYGDTPGRLDLDIDIGLGEAEVIFTE